MEKDSEIKVSEGKAEVYSENEEKTFSAFYNPAQVSLSITRNLIETYPSPRSTHT